MICQACGQTLTDEARFCLKCGTAVPAQPEVEDPLRGVLQQALGTHYHIVRELGRGGMGAVYLAHENGLDRDVAIKVLPPDRAEVAQHRERFRREARTAARLSHPNIVPLYSFGEHDGMLYFVMDYVSGESLADRIRRTGPLPEHEARQLLAAVADALHYAHQQGVLHRDVKPQNILLDAASGRPRLADFGIAKIAAEDSTLTSTGAIVGTPDYLSPEQAAGLSTVGPASDVYSLGVVGYEMLTGTRPFSGTTPGEVIVKRLTTTPSQAPLAAAGASPFLMDVIMRCLRREPADRWPNAAALHRVLTNADEESRDPVESVGLLAIALSYIAAFVKIAWWVSDERGLAIQIASDIASALLVFFWLLVAGALVYSRWQGLGWSRGVRRVFREPKVWRWWYPRAYRQDANVWDRIPRDVRRVRTAGGLILLLFPSFVVPMILFKLSSPDAAWVNYGPYSLRSVFVVLVTGCMAVVAYGLFWSWKATRRLTRMGLTSFEAQRVVTDAPLSLASLWSRPAIADLLEPIPTAAARTKTPTSPIADTAGRSGPDDVTR